MTLLLLYVFGALSISLVCSLLEASFLSVSMGELLGRKQAGDKSATLLLHLKEERLDDSIGAILTLNTIAHTIGAALAGAQAARVFGDAWLGAFSAVLTLAILVFTEIIPKTLGTTNASQLVGFTARTIRLFITVLGPLLVGIRLLTRLFSKGEAPKISRGELGALVSLAARQGLLHHDESTRIANVLRFHEVKAGDVMTPRVVVQMLPSTATIRDLVEHQAAMIHSRIPVWKDKPDQVIGYVLVRDVLTAVARGTSQEGPLVDFLRDPFFVPEMISVDRALEQFLGRREQLAIVTDEYGGVSGVVTLEDLMETILGAEMVDESDRVADLRTTAIELRDRRLQRLQLPPTGPDLP